MTPINRPEVIEHRCYSLQMKSHRRAAGTEPDDAAKAQVSLKGYAAVFNSATVLCAADSWYPGSPEIREVIERGAFAKSIKEGDQRAVWNHNTDYVLGRKCNRTLRLWEDETGLGNEILPPMTDLILDMCVAPIERGDVDQMSFAFRIIKDSVLEEDNVITITLKEVELIEVSPVAIPAYSDTFISARSQTRMEDFKQRRQAADQSEPGAAHSDGDPKPVGEHSGAPKPLNLDHLAESFRMELELATADA